MDISLNNNLLPQARTVTEDDFAGDCSAWLAQQCGLLPKVQFGAVFLHDDGEAGQIMPFALWSSATSTTTGPLERIADVVEQVHEEGCGLVAPLTPAENEDGGDYILALPIFIEGQIKAVLAIVAQCGAEAELYEMMPQLEWGAGGLRAAICEEALTSQRLGSEQRHAATDVLSAVVAESNFDNAGAKFVVELAHLLGCDRVSLGYMRQRKAKVRFISHSAQFGRRMNLVDAIQLSMSEAADQKQTVRYPPPQDSQLLTRAHAALVEASGASYAMSVPLYRDNQFYAVLTLERADAEFSARDARLCEALAAIAESVIEDKRLNDRWLIVKAWDTFVTQSSRVLGVGYVGRKLVLMGLLIVTVFFATFEADYRLAADVVLEGSVQRVIAAPFDGYIKNAQLRAGDISSAEEIIAELDDRELRLEQYKWKSELAQRQTQLEDALGSRERAKIRVLSAQVEQAQAELQLVGSQLERVQLRAPFPGILVSGDLSQRLGSAVTTGEELFRIAPLDTYRVIMQIPESRIEDIALGQHGQVLLSALPQAPLDVVVSSITPITEAREGATYFRIEGTLRGATDGLRPGMIGIAKIAVDRRLLAAIWTRDMREWVRLRWWAFWG